MTIGEDFDDVLERARAGHRDAFEAIYRDLAPVVTGYLRGQGAREPDDLTSEVFVAVVRGLDRFEGGEEGFRSWVFTIAHRRLLDERRRFGRHREDAADPEQLAEVGPSSAGAEEDALSSLATGRALELLEGLTADQRAVVLLRIIGDLPVVEVARILRKREGAVKTLQRRALARLRRNLREHHESGANDEFRRPDDGGTVSS